MFCVEWMEKVMQISRYVSEFNQGNTSYAFEQQPQSTVEPQEAVIHQTQVTLSEQARQLNYSAENVRIQPVLRLDEQQKKSAKAIATYNMVSGFNDGKTSASEAYLIKNNDEMRQAMVEKNMLEHQAAMVESYTEQLSV